MAAKIGLGIKMEDSRIVMIPSQEKNNREASARSDNIMLQSASFDGVEFKGTMIMDDGFLYITSQIGSSLLPNQTRHTI